ncbi:dTDP-4-dehydrorhamnose reductase [Leptospira idonii]|uniref:dTDP-4-dehydrorhamnose reductase n=1 Tax=Leptospira idonii TaxID=1193500 RepID=A0A4R9LZA1_9LEPT|nr:dTDP-4-dehydrorhamnose reductase [Leptospira idonii]TGN18239.1 dTDP-4-dehydrorhamnose reductase [Leptospira idonii]
MSKILVTGSTGQLGNELKEISSVHSEKDRFVFVSRNDLNLLDEKSLSSFLDRNEISSVINAAAYTAVDLAEKETEEAKRINETYPSLLSRLTKEKKIKLIHFSTDFVFDGKSSLPYKENDFKSPISVYGKTKSDGEDRILSNDSNAIIVRTSWVYSRFGKNFVKTILKLGSEREELKVIFDQIGSPTWAKDLAHLSLLLISTDLSGIYHYSNEGVASWYDFAKEIISFSGSSCRVLPIETKDYPTPAARPHYSVMNKSKIKESCKIEIPHWKDSLSMCMNEIKNYTEIK